jgi:HD-like signal output (HDOD) protein
MMLHKTEDKRRLAKQIQEYLSKSPEVRPFPAAVSRLLAACQDPDANCQKFESIIECDPGLSVKILRLANSPLFCPSGAVKGIAHAVSLLGLRKLKSIAMSVAGASLFSAGNGAQQQRQQLWSHSVGCAVVARLLADFTPNVNSDDAFLGGVFHDVGKLLFYDVIPIEYAQIESSFDGLSLVEEEAFIMGTTHEEIGLISANSWKLPDEVKAAVGWHHRPDEASLFPEIAAITGVADQMAKRWGIGSETTNTCSSLDDQVNGDCGFTEEDLIIVERKAHKAFCDTMAAAVS